ncbi:MAG: baseplate J/gp47 family protein [Moorellaceae bacterium]
MEVKTFFDLVTDGLNYLKANTSQITSLYAGGRARTLIEVYALLLSELYLYVNDRLKASAAEGLYAALDFPPLPATQAVCQLTFTGTAGTVIPAGTIVQTAPGVYSPPVQFTTDSQAQIPTGSTSVTVNATAVVPGAAGNVAANTLTVLVSQVQGIQSVTNPNPAYGGKDAETEPERAYRFSQYIASLTQGTVAALNYAAQQVTGVAKTAVVEPPLVVCHTQAGTTYTDQSAEANIPWGVPFPAFNSMPAVGDSIYIGAGVMFNSLYINFFTPGAGISGSWQYYNGSSWVTLAATDNTSGLTKSGSVTFTAPSDWQATTVNGKTAFYIRFTLSSATITTVPQIYHILALNPPPGWVNLIVYGTNGLTTSSLLQQVQQAVYRAKAAGIQVNVYPATVKTLNVTVTAKVPQAYNNATTQQSIANAIIAYINNLAIGQPLYLAQLTAVIIGVNGGSTVAQVTYTTPTGDVIVPADTLIVPGTITVNLQTGS